MSESPIDRFMNPIRRIIRDEVAQLTYLGTWEYAVNSVNDDGTVNVTATSPSCPLPSLNNVAQASGTEGGTSTPGVGKMCNVRFINGDPTRYVVVGNQSLVKVATIDASETVAIGASVSNAVVLAGGDAPVARMGDACTVYFPIGTTPCFGTITPLPPAGGAFVGNITFTSPAVGVIGTGAPKVLA